MVAAHMRQMTGLIRTVKSLELVVATHANTTMVKMGN